MTIFTMRYIKGQEPMSDVPPPPAQVANSDYWFARRGRSGAGGHRVHRG